MLFKSKKEKDLDKLCKSIADYIDNEKNYDYRLNIHNAQRLQKLVDYLKSQGFRVNKEPSEPKEQSQTIDFILYDDCLMFGGQQYQEFLNEIKEADGISIFLSEKNKILVEFHVSNVYEHK